MKTCVCVCMQLSFAGLQVLYPTDNVSEHTLIIYYSSYPGPELLMGGIDNSCSSALADMGKYLCLCLYENVAVWLL